MLSLLRGLIAISPFILLMTFMLCAAMNYGGILWVLFGTAAVLSALVGGLIYIYAEFKAALKAERAAKAA